MQVFNLTDLARNWSTLKHAAAKDPIALAERRKTRFVLMAVEDYEKLSAGAKDPRQVFKLDEAPTDLAALMVEGLAEITTLQISPNPPSPDSSTRLPPT